MTEKARERLQTNVPKKRRGRGKWKRRLHGYLFVAPLIGFWLVFGAYPYLRGILIPFQDYRLLERETWAFSNSFIGFGNFVEALKDKFVWKGLRDAFLLYVSWFPLTTVFSLFTAVMLSRVRRGWLAAVYRVLITLAWVIPLPMAMGMWRLIYEPNFGYLNHFLKRVLRIWPDPPVWTADPTWFWPALGVACTWKGFGYYMLLFLVGLYNVPQDLYDAARVDGANAWQEFWHVELPSIRNIMLLFIVTNLGFLGAGIVETHAFVDTTEALIVLARPIALHGYMQAFWVGRLGYGAAIWFSTGLITLCLVTIAFKLIRSEKA